MRRSLAFVLLACSWIVEPSAGAEDPLDTIDGTEDWDELDTTSVDETEAWRLWKADMNRLESGRLRLEQERENIRRVRQRLGFEVENEYQTEELSGQVEWQEKIDAIRRSFHNGGSDRRDVQGQTLDDERPWSRR